MNAVTDKIKVLVVDDHPVVRRGLQTCLSRQPSLKVVGEAEDGEAAVNKARELLPDVVLLDIDLPKMSGLAVIELLRKESPHLKVLVLSVHTNRQFIFRIIQAGAHGYVSKEASPEKLVSAIESVWKGDPFFTPEVAQAAISELVRGGGKTQPAAKLSDREREVLALIAEGRSNKEVAERLGIGVRTIETHRERIMRKLNIHSIAGLTRFAIVNNIISLE